jgi:two-component system phosphate regulon sensor histidine kinase PhoR
VRNRIFFKLLAASLVVIAATTFIVDFTVTRAWERSLHQQIETALTQKARLFALRVEHDHSLPMQQIVDQEAAAADARATVIERSGKVLGDSGANAGEMENHATRPEFIAAFQGRVGSSSRWSHTLGIQFLYVAVPVEGGAVRLAYPLSAIQQEIAQVRHTILWGSGLAVLLSLALSAVAARSLSRRLERIVEFAGRIAAGDLTARIAEPSSDEIGKVAGALDSTAHQLQRAFDDLRASQQRLETVLHGMQEAVIAIGPDRKAQWSNDRMAALVPGGIRLGAPVVESVRDPDFLHAVEGALAGGIATKARATSILPGRSFEVTAAPVPGSGAVAVLHDVSDIERVEKTRRDFIANVSHELRTPLTSIQGYAETLLESESADSEREFLEIIAKNAARMSRLTEDLLTLARVESGEKAFDFKSVEPEGLLRDAVESFREAARGRGTVLEIENGATQLVRADSDAIHQVLTNLVDNALKYAGSTPKIVVGARDAKDGVEFFVRDFGQGIASEHLPRLFERFYRVDKARSRESGGTGLGLAIAKHIIRAHGGSIRVESELGHGATFFFILPAAAMAVAAEKV